MKFLSGSSAEKVQGATLHGDEYDFGDADINAARLAISGRYPETGRTMNTVSKMCCFILEGSGSLNIEDSSFELEAGDACIIEPNEKYYWEADMTLLITSTPAWNAAEQKQVE